MDTNTIIWLLLAGAGIWLFIRMLKGGGCCGGGDEAEESRSAHAGHAGHAGKADVASPVHAVDPVCGMEVSATSVHRIQHQGQTRFFCSSRCQERYEADPERYEAAAAETAPSL